MRRSILTIAFVLKLVFVSSQLQVVYNEDLTCGYKDSKTGKAIPGDYNKCGEFIGNEALVERDGKFILLNKEGAQVNKYSYKFVNHKKSGELEFLTDSTTGTIDIASGKVFEVKFNHLFHAVNCGSDIYVMKTDSLIGLYSKDQGLLLPIEYQTDDFETTFMKDGDLYFSNDAVFPFKYKGKWGLTDIFGKMLAPFEYDHINTVYYEDNLVAAQKNGKWGLLDRKGKVLLPLEYACFLGRQRWGDDRAHYPYVFLNEGKITFYDESFKKIVTSVARGEYTWNRVDHTSLYYNGKRGVINNKGNILVPFEYDQITIPQIPDSVKAVPVYHVRKGNKWALFKPYNGNVTDFVECEDLTTLYFKGKMLSVVKRNSKIILHDMNLKPLSSAEYDSVEAYNDVYYIKIREKQGVLSSDGSIKWN